jgi:outer membrane protein assembly factor BamB
VRLTGRCVPAINLSVEEYDNMMRSLSLGLVVCSLLLFLPAAFGDDWATWRGPNLDGMAPDTGINKDWNARPPQKLWQVPLTDGSYSGPSVADGKVFVLDHQGNQDIVRALDFATGDEIWRFTYQDIAKPDQGTTRSTPVFCEGKLYTVSNLGKVHCLDAATGEVIWLRDMRSEFGGQRPTWGYAMSVFIDGVKAIICPGGNNASVAAVNKDTGETIWAGGGSDIAGYATPVRATIQGQDQYVVFTGVSLIGVSVDGGPALWRVPWVNKYKVNAATPIVSGDHIFITSDYEKGCAVVAVEQNGASILWENREISAHFSSPIHYEGYLYANSNPGFLLCFDVGTGAPVWKQQGFEKGGLIIVDGVIIAVVGNSGDVVMAAATPESYRELGRIRPLSGQSWTAPVIADGKLLIRNKQAIVCLDLM